MKKMISLCTVFLLLIFCIPGCAGRTSDTETITIDDDGQQSGQSISDIEEQNDEITTEAPEVTEESVSGENVTDIPEVTMVPSITSIPESISITVTATGDCTLGTTQLQSYEDSFDEVYDNQGYEYFFDNVRDVFEQDDFTLINLECCLTTSDDRQEKEWNLRGKPEYVDILTCSSVEAVSMGNNHRMDYGEAGLEETVQVVEDADIVYAYDDVIGRYETKGITIGIVSVNEHYDGTLVEEYLKEGIARLQEEGTDLIIACCHWGIEGTSRLDDYQEELGYKCIDWGADLVIGNHPHVLQGIDIYNGKYLVYSLGNFCFGGNKNPKDKDTMIFQQTFTFMDQELQTDNNIRIIPCSISSVKNKNNFQPTPAADSLAEHVIDKVNGYCEDFGLEFGPDGYLQQD